MSSSGVVDNIATTKIYRRAEESMSAAGLAIETFTDVVPELPVDGAQAAAVARVPARTPVAPSTRFGGSPATSESRGRSPTSASSVVRFVELALGVTRLAGNAALPPTPAARRRRP